MEVQCNLCNHFVELGNYDTHYSKCSSIKYIQRKLKELYNQDVDYNELYRMDKVEFTKKYFWTLNRVYENVKNDTEKKSLENVLYGPKHNLKEMI